MDDDLHNLLPALKELRDAYSELGLPGTPQDARDARMDAAMAAADKAIARAEGG